MTQDVKVKYGGFYNSKVNHHHGSRHLDLVTLMVYPFITSQIFLATISFLI